MFCMRQFVLLSLFHPISSSSKKMKKQLNSMLKKCQSVSRQLRRSHSYSSPRSKSSREEGTFNWEEMRDEQQQQLTVSVGNARRQYAISAKHMKHPLLNALIDEKSKQNPNGVLSVKCEVVLFDHLLWMLENADPATFSSDSLEELVELYAL